MQLTFSSTWKVVLAALLLLPASLQAESASAESGLFVLNLYGDKNPFAVSEPGQGRGSADSGYFLLDLRGIRGATLKGYSSESPVFVVNLSGREGQLSLSGTIYDASTGRPIVGANVRVGEQIATSDFSGAYRVTSISYAEIGVSVSHPGYTALDATVIVPAGVSVHRDFSLFPTSTLGTGWMLRITSVRSKFPGFLYFLEGVDAPVTWTATVDWGGRSPGKLIFSCPLGEREVTTAANSASTELNMGRDFGPGGRLRVKAVASDGSVSAETLADCVVMPNVLPAVFSHVASADSFYFKARLGPNWEFLDLAMKAGIVPSSIPLFGGHELKLKFIPTFEAELRRNLMDFGLALEGRALPSFKIAGQEVALTPFAEISGAYNLPGQKWQWEGSAGVNFSEEIRTPAVYLPNPLALPLYFKVAFKPEINVTGSVIDLAPFAFSASSRIKPYLRGSLGAGIDSVFSGEGWIGGGAEIEFQFPREPHLNNFTILINGGVTVYALLFKWENELLRWEWDLKRGSLADLNFLANTLEQEPMLIQREYIRSGNYAAFAANLPGSSTKRSAAKPRPLSATVAPLQTRVFPISEPMLAAAEGRASLVWLFDNTNRTAINRTMTVFSRFDGSAWSEPVAVADDGTADFHPQVVAFTNGTAIAVWENQKAALPANATFDDMKRNLEISMSWFEPVTGKWKEPINLTTNSFLDRTPKLAGIASNNLLVAWVSNQASNPSGSASDPNEIWFSQWNGQQWSQPRMIASIPNALLKYDLTYQGAEGWLVCSLDMDGDSNSVNDHDLFRTKFQSGLWGPLERITDNAAPDDNPLLALDERGRVVLTWLRGPELSGVVNFDMSRRQVIRRDEYSSNLGDFKLARNASGSLAIVWSEPSEFSSDLWAMFYDPAFRLWGNGRQLTHDRETERGVTAVMLSGNTLLAVYNRTELGLNANAAANPGQALQMVIPKPGETDLYVLQYRLGDDVALRGGLLETTPSNPGPGEKTAVRFAVENRGDRAVEDTVIAFFLGDPTAGGIEIGQTNLNQTISAGQTISMVFDFEVPATRAPVTIFALVDPSLSVLDAVRSNNTASLTIAQSDLGLSSVAWSPISANLLSVTARVSNEGAVNTQVSTLELHSESVTGPVLFTRSLDSLVPGQSVDVNFQLDPSTLPNSFALFPVLKTTGYDFRVDNNAALLLIQRIPSTELLTLGPVLQLASGLFQITVRGLNGQPFVVEASADLIEWRAILQTNGTQSVIQVVDPDSGNLSSRFYRAKR